MPVAERAGVYIGIHPDDPPVYPLGGVPRALFGSFAGFCKAMEIADSPNIGVCLCLGCWPAWPRGAHAIQCRSQCKRAQRCTRSRLFPSTVG